MGLFDFFKKKATEEQPQTEEQQEGVLELDGVEVETDAQEADIVLDVEDGQDMNRAVHAVMDEEEIQIDRAGEDILYREEAEEAPAEAEIEITFEDADGEEILTAEDAAEAEAVLDELTEIAGEILAEKPLAEDEVIVATEDGEIFTADNDADGRAFVEELADEVAEELNQEETAEEAQKTPAEESAEEEKPAKMGFFAKLKAGLDKTRKNILGGVDGVLGAFTKIDEDLFEELEEALIMADMGVQTTMDIVENLRKRVKREHATDPAVIKDMLIDEITEILQEGAQEDENLPSPSVLLVIGVNGVGKTTTIGKLAHNFKEDGKSVLLAAEWDILTGYETDADVPDRLWWPVRLMNYLARFPHEFKTWLGWGHTLPNSADCVPYDESTKLCGAMLGALQENISMFRTEDDTQINMYCVIPLYKEEMEYQKAAGTEALMQKLSVLNGYGMIVFPDRPNVCAEEE